MTTLACPACAAADTGTAFCESCGGSLASLRAEPQVGAVSAAPTSVPPSVTLHQAVAPSAATISIATVFRIVTLVLLVAGAVVPAVFWLAVSGLNSTAISRFGYEADGSIVVSVMAALLNALAGVAAIFASLVSPVATSRRVGGAVFALVGGAALALSSVGISTGVSGSITSAFATGTFFFLSWALTRPIAGQGFLAALILLPVAIGLGFLPLYYFPYVAATLLNTTLVAAVPVLGVSIALAFERRRARRLGLATGARNGGADWPISARPNTAASFALVLAIAAISLPAVIVGHVALRRVALSGEAGRGLALAGLVIGYLGIALVIIYIVVLGASLALIFGTVGNYGY